MLPASWRTGACPGGRLLDAPAVLAVGDAPWRSPNTAPAPVSRIAASPAIRIRYRMVVTSVDGPAGGTGGRAGVPPGSCVLELDRRPVRAAGCRRWQQHLPGHARGEPAPA